MTNTLQKHVPASADADSILEGFLAYVGESGLSLYAAQEEALLEIVAGKNVILNTPTGSGKSLVALGMQFKAFAEGKRVFYTCPIKALVSEKFFALCEAFGAEHVGMMTGDATVNHEAPVICCTAEILSNMALRDGDQAPVDYVIMDEFHYYSDPERGVAWQVPLLTLPQATFLLMSATLGDTTRFEEALTTLNGQPTALVRSSDRPVPLDWEYSETPLHETIAELLQRNKAPVYLVNFTQRAAAEQAQNLMSVDVCTKEEKRAIALELQGVRFSSPYGKEIARHLKHGIGVHHAGLLPKYRRAVERLAQKGLLKIISGTDTLGVGVNIPIRTVLFTQLCKYDGQKTAILRVRDFHQISGRAGRKGFDDRGWVVAQAPEHVIENKRLEAKAVGDPKKAKKLVRQKPPEKGFVMWDAQTFERLRNSMPEPLESRFSVSHGMLVNVLSRGHEGCGAMKSLIRTCHEGPTRKKALAREGIQLLRSLYDAQIVDLVPRWDARGKMIQINQDLQLDFALNQALSLYALETLQKLEIDSDSYALDVLSLLEATLENPDIILIKQLDKLKGQKIAELKAQGVEYDDRMAELEKLEYPKPNREFIYDTFNAFAKRQPWLSGENIRPKSIAREMFEEFYSFSDYIKDYGLERSEGLLLRYLSNAYKALVQTIPESRKTDDVLEIEDYLRAMLRGTDSSLLEEWENLRDPSNKAKPSAERPEVSGEAALAAEERTFTLLIRNEIYRFVRFIAFKQYDLAAAVLQSFAVPAVPGQLSDAWTPKRLETAMAEFYASHVAIVLTGDARSNRTIRVDKGDGEWRVRQALLDEEGDNDWELSFDVHLAESEAHGHPVMRFVSIGPIAS